MNALEECHAKGFMYKSLGMCNKMKNELGQCLKAERSRHQDANRSRTTDKKDRVRQLWKEIDENS